MDAIVDIRLGLMKIVRSGTTTSILFDPWLFDVPIICKPTYINMNFNFNNVMVSDLIF